MPILQCPHPFCLTTQTDISKVVLNDGTVFFSSFFPAEWPTVNTFPQKLDWHFTRILKTKLNSTSTAFLEPAPLILLSTTIKHGERIPSVHQNTGSQCQPWPLVCHPKSTSTEPECPCGSEWQHINLRGQGKLLSLTLACHLKGLSRIQSWPHHTVGQFSAGNLIVWFLLMAWFPGLGE